MGTLQDMGYVVLCCAVALESIALRSILQETLWLKGLSCSPEDESETDATRTTEIPRFHARILDSPNAVTDDDIRGRDALLLFFNAPGALALRPEVFQGTVYALWGKTDECLYIVCEGSEDECRLLRDRHRLRESYGESIKILLDDSSDLTALFGVTATPSAIMFDEDGRVRKTGQLSKVGDASEDPAIVISA